MKNISILIMMFVLLFSCSSNSSLELTNEPMEENIEQHLPNDNNGQSEQFKLLEAIYYNDHNGSKTRLFSYGDVTLNTEFDSWILDFEYDSEGKILTQGYCYADGVTPENIENYQCSSFHRIQNYYYSDGLLTSFASRELNEEQEVYDSHELNISYNEFGNIVSEIYENNSFENHYYTYNSSAILLTQRVEYIPESSNYTITYEFDEKNNPLYPLWQNFGYYREPWDDDTILTPIFVKNNITKYYIDGELKMEAEYTYDDDGYPLFVAFKRYFSNDVTRNGSITYEYME